MKVETQCLAQKNVAGTEELFVKQLCRHQICKQDRTNSSRKTLLNKQKCKAKEKN